MSLSFKAQHFSYKTLLLIVIFLLIPIVLLLRVNQRANPAVAGWFDESWHYRQAINISNTASALTNIQVKLLSNSDLSALVTAGKLQASLNDLRFTDAGGKLFSYWIEDSTNSSVDVWGFIPSVPSGGATIYMYYGNSSASGASSTTNMTIGGTMTSVGGYRIHTFTGNGTLTNAITANAEVLVVAGGGGGGSSTLGSGGGGGGGGGGLTYNSSYALTQGQTINVTIGVGGSAGATNGNQPGSNGGNSVFGTITVNGGGGGANVFSNGLPGGSGGGGGYNGYSTVKYGGSGVVGIGNSGGNTSQLSWAGGAGGGGAGGVGGDNKINHAGGDGGLGLNYTVTGVGVTYAAGGGGGANNPSASPANTGKGGDAAYAGGTAYAGANGIVVVRYLSAAAGTPATEEVSKAPIAYWKLDEGIGATVNNSAENKTFTGSISGPTWQTENQCISGKCLDYSATAAQSIAISNNITAGWAANNDFTLSMWFNCKGEGISVGSTQYDYLAGLFIHGTSAHSGTGGFFVRQLSTTCQSVQFLVGTATADNSISVNLSSGQNNWSHLVAVKSGDVLSFYENGVQKATQTFAGANWYVNPALESRIGYVHGRSIKGLIDEVKVYPYARTVDEIKQDYNLGASALIGHKQEIAQVTPLKSKLLAHYKFDEGYGTTVHNSGNGGNSLNITLGAGTSAPAWTINGKFGKALSFNPSESDFATLTDPNSFDLGAGKDISWSAWIKLNGQPSGYSSVIHKMYGTWNDGYFAYFNNSYTFNWSVFKTPVYQTWSATADLTAYNNQWIHLVGTFTHNDSIKLYLNGKLVDNQAVNGNGVDSAADFSIGGYGNGNWVFNGLVDEVKIYNYALTADEIKLDYNQGSAMQLGNLSSGTGNTAAPGSAGQEYCVPGDTATCLPPIARWDFEEGIGATAYDTSENENNGGWNGTLGNQWTTGKVGKAGKFNGSNNYVSLGSLNNLSGNAETVTFWAKTFAFSDFAPFIDSSLGGGATTGRFYVGYYYSGSPYFHVFVGDGTSLGAINFNYSIPLNIWKHYAVSLDGTNVKLYVDGVLFDTKSTANTLAQGIYTIARGFGGAGYFNGLIDQVRVYNYARSPAQIAWDYNKGAPVAHYKFDECQGTTIHSTNSFYNSALDGTLVVGASGSQNSVGTCAVGTSAAWTNGTTGKINSSLNFDGTDDYISIGSSLTFTDSISVSTWFNTNTSSNPNDHRMLITLGPDFSYLSLISNGVGNPFISLNIGSSQRTLNSNFVPSIGIWYHVVATWDGDKEKIYVNGILKNTSPSYTGALNTSGTKYIGKYNYSGYGFSGQIDDVQIFNYALTAAQAKTVYNDGAVNFR